MLQSQKPEWEDIVRSVVDLRHSLHRRPELPWAEVTTADTIRTHLTAANISWRDCAGTGTVATLAANASGRHIALRCDIDALPLSEKSGVAWTSEVDGCMHACGHDGHTATLMATALWLKSHEDALPGPVTLLFQPAEEGGHGAREMIKDGALSGVDMIFGWHNWPAIAFGKAVCPDGAVMSANGTFGITVQGQGGHASQPEICRDPVLAAAAITLALQQIVARRLPPQQSAVLSVTSILAPSGDTVIPDTAQIGGSFRLSDNRLRKTMEDLIIQTAQDTARTYGVTADIDMRPRYGATVNNAGAAATMRRALAEEFGQGWKSDDTLVPIMASEDFSYYLDEIPGAYALIGADNGGRHGDAPCHSALYDFNDALIPAVARVYLRLAAAPLPKER
ncbi:N(2)-acetyl-L-2,4-diaminobutanoate deacetylase DoeB2 [Paremcibacter congregatus]|uniref:Peptidase M20 n=1 Tax=Paremcibacter congregatus TaxID=2043170 RepID=A0A2G4YS97_9PROT|nr:peptidase M20 [Paremcibacter congregatus]QDE27853.1 amidohydrolase [Paremcibacter congregatus]